MAIVGEPRDTKKCAKLSQFGAKLEPGWRQDGPTSLTSFWDQVRIFSCILGVIFAKIVEVKNEQLSNVFSIFFGLGVSGRRLLGTVLSDFGPKLDYLGRS